MFWPHVGGCKIVSFVVVYFFSVTIYIQYIYCMLFIFDSWITKFAISACVFSNNFSVLLHWGYLVVIFAFMIPPTVPFLRSIFFRFCSLPCEKKKDRVEQLPELKDHEKRESDESTKIKR